MRVVSLLSFYDEKPGWLAAAVASCAPFSDHLIAVDGAYALYPEGRATSPQDQADTISDTARACGLGVTIHQPRTVWAGNEVEKRSAMFALGEAITTETDWYFVIDADEIVSRVPPDLHSRLEATEYDVGEVTFWERNQPPPENQPEHYYWPPTSSYTIRIMFRALRGLRVDTKHYRYMVGDRMMWGDGPLEPALDFTDLRVEHKTKYRHEARRRSAKAYYDKRDEMNIECLFPHRPQLA